MYLLNTIQRVRNMPLSWMRLMKHKFFSFIKIYIYTILCSSFFYVCKLIIQRYICVLRNKQIGAISIFY